MAAEEDKTPASSSRIPLAALCCAFVLSLGAHLAVMPLGEGMDFFGHLAYIIYYAEEGRPPLQDDRTKPAWIVNMAEVAPAPDHSASGARYRAWAEASADERARVKTICSAVSGEDGELIHNYESQQPPLYYWIMSRLWRLMPTSLPLGGRTFLLGLASVLAAALGLPAVYLMMRDFMGRAPALIAALCVAWHPGLVAFVARTANDPMAFSMIAWTLYFCVRTRRSESLLNPLGAGVFFGLACLTKAYCITLLPVCVVAAFAGKGGHRWGKVAVSILTTSAGALLLFAYNLVAGGSVLLSWHMKITDAIPLIERVGSLFRINLFWFFSGLAKGVWWSGSWSFVSPGWFYYLPLLLVPVLLAWGLRGRGWKESWGEPLSVSFLHILAIGCFVLGLAWHAGMHALASRILGRTLVQGNEGWYLNAVAPSFYVIVFAFARARLTGRDLERVLRVFAVFLIVWNLVGRLALFAFWTGLTHPAGRLRAVGWGQALRAFGEGGAENWLSLPGVIHPVTLSFVLPLACAIVLSLAVLRGAMKRAGT